MNLFKRVWKSFSVSKETIDDVVRDIEREISYLSLRVLPGASSRVTRDTLSKIETLQREVSRLREKFTQKKEVVAEKEYVSDAEQRYMIQAKVLAVGDLVLVPNSGQTFERVQSVDASAKGLNVKTLRYHFTVKPTDTVTIVKSIAKSADIYAVERRSDGMWYVIERILGRKNIVNAFRTKHEAESLATQLNSDSAAKSSQEGIAVTEEMKQELSVDKSSTESVLPKYLDDGDIVIIQGQEHTIEMVAPLISLTEYRIRDIYGKTFVVPANVPILRKVVTKTETKNNPWAICHSQGLTGDNFERCVLHVKEKFGIHKSVTEDGFSKGEVRRFKGPGEKEIVIVHNTIYDNYIVWEVEGRGLSDSIGTFDTLLAAEAAAKRALLKLTAKSIDTALKALGTEAAGPIPNTLLAEQDLEGSSTE